MGIIEGITLETDMAGDGNFRQGSRSTGRFGLNREIWSGTQNFVPQRTLAVSKNDYIRRAHHSLLSMPLAAKVRNVLFLATTPQQECQNLNRKDILSYRFA